MGVFPLDRLPSYLKPGSRFIVNTDTHNLPGQHWIGVIFERNGIIKAFDPLGFFYPPALQIYLKRHLPRTIWYNRVMHQSPHETTCGKHVLIWLNRYKHILLFNKYYLIWVLYFKTLKVLQSRMAHFDQRSCASLTATGLRHPSTFSSNQDVTGKCSTKRIRCITRFKTCTSWHGMRGLHDFVSLA